MKTWQDWAMVVFLWIIVAALVAVVAGRFLRVCSRRDSEVIELSPETFDAADRAKE